MKKIVGRGAKFWFNSLSFLPGEIYDQRRMSASSTFFD